MVLQTSAALLVLAPLSVLAQWDEYSNFTIKLYPSDGEDRCEEGGDGALTITTETVPRDFTCIDVEKIFSGNRRVGFLNDTVSHQVIYDDDEDVDSLPPPGIDWYITSDSAEYDSAKNWTNIWFEQRNQSSDGESEEGEDGRWVVTTWANTECERWNVTDFPWFETSCQTSEDGQCESVPYSIKGIGIRPYFAHEFDDCQTWAQTGAAAELVPRVSAALMVTMVYFLLL